MTEFDALFERCGAAALESTFGEPVVFARGSRRWGPLVATWERREYEVTDTEGFHLKVESRDFVFSVSAIGMEPVAGDRLLLMPVGSGEVYELLRVGSRPAAERVDGGRRWRVHTKRVE